MSVWFVLAIILIFIEMSTVNLVSIWFAIGCLVAGIVGLVIENSIIQNLERKKPVNQGSYTWQSCPSKNDR